MLGKGTLNNKNLCQWVSYWCNKELNRYRNDESLSLADKKWILKAIDKCGPYKKGKISDKKHLYKVILYITRFKTR